MKPILSLVLAAVIAGTGASAADAKRPLREISEIDDSLFHIAVADEIRKKCDTISGRVIKALLEMRRLQRYAHKLGYSDAEIEAYVESEEEQERMLRRGLAYLAEHGASRDDPASLCALGRAEIERKSAIGAYLRAK